MGTDVNSGHLVPERGALWDTWGRVHPQDTQWGLVSSRFFLDAFLLWSWSTTA